MVIIFLMCLFVSISKKEARSLPNSKTEDILNSKIQQLEVSLETSLTENKSLIAHKMRLQKDLESQLEKYNTLLSDYDDVSSFLVSSKNKLEEKIRQLELRLDASLSDNKILIDCNAQLQNDLQLQSKKYDALLSDYDKLTCNLNTYIERRNDDLKNIFSNCDHAFSYVAVLYADYLLLDYDNASKYLLNKKRPATSEGLRIGALKQQTKSYLVELNKTKYQLNYLLNSYPQLEDFIESDDDDEDSSSTDDKLSDDTWCSLSETQRNQLRLTNYLNRRKSKWEIGRDYELYVGYKYSLQGYSVDYFGSYNGLEDLGRDLIVKRNGEIGIIQCKYWSSKKQIHEKHIAQLYGTVVSYIIENNYIPSLVHGIFITNISLSDTAKKFANFLDIKYKENYPIGEFPRIKCNINKDEYGNETKIYHLPTDQQYDNVKIEHIGECFVFTVDEAEKLGFRHAYKWHNK